MLSTIIDRAMAATQASRSDAVWPTKVALLKEYYQTKVNSLESVSIGYTPVIASSVALPA